jgi:SNF2 family DNA or RNA helicase
MQQDEKAPSLNDFNDALFAAAQAEQKHNIIKDPPTLSVKDDVGALIFPALSLTNFEKGKQIPTRARWEGRTLRFKMTDAAMTYIYHHWPNFKDTRVAPPKAVVHEQLKPVRTWTPRLPAFKHQKTALELARGLSAFAYFMDMGTGKSKCLIDEMAELYACAKINRALIVAPAGVHYQWFDEQLPTHWPTELPMQCAFVGQGAKNKWPEFNDDGAMIILCVNIDALTMRPMTNKLIKFVADGKTLVAIDESQKIKNSQATRTTRCFELGEPSLYRRIMTGTPMAKGPEDYYAQFKFLDLGIIAVRSFAGFKRQYCEIGGFGGNSVIGYRNTEQLHQLIAPYSYRIEKSDCIDLPPKMYQRVPVELGVEQRSVYLELKHQLLTELTDGTIIAAEQAVQRILRLQQVVQGFLPREDGSFEEYDLSNRLAALDDLIEGSHSKVVVWCRFRHDINLIMDRYQNIAVRYDGAVGQADREVNKRQFLDKDSTARLFISNAQAGGAGLNLAGLCNTVIYFSNSFSSLDRWQSEDRTHRIGTQGTVTYYDIVARGTIDINILSNLRRKKDITDMSLNELRSLIEDSDGTDS